MIDGQLSLSPGLGGSWGRSIRRADQLAADSESAASLLVFYGRVLRHQKSIHDALSAGSPSGSIERDMSLFDQPRSALLRDLIAQGPEPLAAEACALLTNDGAATASLLAYWQTRSDRQFFAKAVLQAYGSWLPDDGASSCERAPVSGSRCPRCGGLPQLSILGAVGAAADTAAGGSCCVRPA
jgi:hypothetical protein